MIKLPPTLVSIMSLKGLELSMKIVYAGKHYKELRNLNTELPTTQEEAFVRFDFSLNES